MSSENTRRIAKNTAMLYIRMLLTMAVTLYTSRVVLNVLGVEDFEGKLVETMKYIFL